MTRTVTMPRPRAPREQLDGRAPTTLDGVRPAPDPTGLWGPPLPEDTQEPRKT